jgi:integrase
MNRRSPTHKGVYQRCTDECPADRCRTHKWAYAIELPAGPNGKRRQPTKGGFATAKEAAAARAEVLRQYQTKQLPVDGSRRFGEWVTEYIDGLISRGEIENSTELTYRTHARLYLVPKLGHVKLTDLTARMLTQMYAEIARERDEERATAQAKNAAYEEEAEQVNAKRAAAGMRPVRVKHAAVPRPISPSTCHRIHALVSGALKSAKKHRLVLVNVAPDADLAKAEYRKYKPWTPEQYGQFLDFIETHRLYPLLLLAGHSGLRRGELVGLRWEDVNLTTGRVVVHQQRVSVGYQVHERTPKTEAGEDRVVYLDTDMCLALRAWRKAQVAEQLAWGPAYQGAGYVFTREDGAPYHPQFVSDCFKRLVRNAGLPHTKLHGLRHFRAHALISSGADIAAVSITMGHATVDMTRKLYGGLFEKAGQALAEQAAGIVPRKSRTA